MSTRGRSTSPHPLHDADVDMENGANDKPNAKVVIVTNLTRSVVESHLQTIFGFYGEIIKIDLPVYPKSGQNRGKAALEYVHASSAHKAASHMNGGQLDGATLKVELSDLPVRSRSHSRSRRSPLRPRNGREKPGGRSYSRSVSRSRSPPPPTRGYGPGGGRRGGYGDYHVAIDYPHEEGHRAMKGVELATNDVAPGQEVIPSVQVGPVQGL
ncbi:hypothetical protein NLI96_g1926 [Meripilus lineatus]|uniref:RRM domain-containing protein n=1 Tax=Meripilus lineatus TaxID=2056292 RepID=A0AAD5V999_9APHY|nr:hypothetical protein NLI96_g1926 [Physisporinus lineatus]